MSDSISNQENFIEEPHTIEEIIAELRNKKLKLLKELNVVENAIKYQSERLKPSLSKNIVEQSKDMYSKTPHPYYIEVLNKKKKW